MLMRTRSTSLVLRPAFVAAMLSSAFFAASYASAQAPAPSTGQRYGRLLIRNANVIDGTGNPTRGPFDILVQNNMIVAIQASRPSEASGSSLPCERQHSIVAHAKLSAENKIAAPTIMPYAVAGANTPDEAHALVKRLKQQGAVGLKVFINRPDVWEAIADEAKRQGLPIATDMKIQELDAIGASRLGVKSIEHWYGISH